MERVYVETTFVSYLTAWPNRDVVIAGHQQITREWWEMRRESYELCISQLVWQEAEAGDPTAASDRLEILQTMVFLETPTAALPLARKLIEAGRFREKHPTTHCTLPSPPRTEYHI